MARQRRGGGFRPPELRGTLGTLLRTTLAQAGTLRDVLERGAREGRSRLDSALSNRRRSDALAELGEIVLDLIRRGEIDLGELPEVRDIVAHLDEIDAGLDDEHDDHADHAPPRRDDDQDDPRPARARFDARPSSSGRPPSAPSRAAGGRARTADDADGTVSSRTWTRPSSAKPAPRVWRPPADDVDNDAADSAESASSAPPPPARPSGPGPSRMSGARPPARNDDTVSMRPVTRPSSDDLRAAMSRKDPARKGGIHFDDDEDLAEYMRPDDVPPKPAPDGDS